MLPTLNSTIPHLCRCLSFSVAYQSQGFSVCAPHPHPTQGLGYPHLVPWFLLFGFFVCLSVIAILLFSFDCFCLFGFETVLLSCPGWSELPYVDQADLWSAHLSLLSTGIMYGRYSSQLR